MMKQDARKHNPKDRTFQHPFVLAARWRHPEGAELAPAEGKCCCMPITSQNGGKIGEQSDLISEGEGVSD